MNDVVTSLQNPRIKALVRLQDKAAERREQGLVVIEGHKEISLAVNAGLVIRDVYRCEALGAPQPARGNVIEVSRDVFAKIAYRDDSDGLVAVAEAPRRELATLGAVSFVIVVAAVEKPGNLGAIVRTADGVGADAVIVCEPRCDVWNPNAIRASVGTIFAVPVVACTSEDARAWLRERGIRTAAAVLSGVELWDALLTGPLAIVLGTEHEGLDAAWIEAADVRVKIPMRGTNDSLNVSVAAAVLAYEAARQRRAAGR